MSEMNNFHFKVCCDKKISIHPSFTAYPGPVGGFSTLSKKAQTSLIAFIKSPVKRFAKLTPN